MTEQQRIAVVLDDLTSIRNNLRAAEAIITDNGPHMLALAKIVMALKPMLRLVAEAHGVDEYGNLLEATRDD